MELIQLLSFHEIVKSESFSKASKTVFRSQSAISHQIKNLETELGVKLFQRLGKRVKLTKEGDILFDITGKFLNDLENLKNLYSDMQHGDAGNLTIATSSSVMTYVLPDVIKNLVNKFPRINFKLIICSYLSQIVSLILDGEIDFGIGMKSNQVLQKKICFLSWKSFDSILVTCKKHPLSHKRIIKLSDVAKYPHILYGKGSMVRQNIEETYLRNKITFDIIMEVDVAESVKTYVEMGIGVGILGSFTLGDKDKKRFTIHNVGHIFGKMEVGIYYREDKYISTAMRQFVKLFDPGLSNKLIL